MVDPREFVRKLAVWLKFISVLYVKNKESDCCRLVEYEAYTIYMYESSNKRNSF